MARIAFTTGERGKEKPPFISGGAGAEDQNRTGDTLIFSQVLYQLSYLGERCIPIEYQIRLGRYEMPIKTDFVKSQTSAPDNVMCSVML